MRFIKTVTLLTIILSSQLVNASDSSQGKQLFTTHCADCHGAQGGMDMSKRIAPPIIAVKKHYIGPHPDKEAFVAAIVSWVNNPDRSNSLMRGAIRKFSLMPKISVSNEDTKKIATYIYQGKLDEPKGFQKHMNEMHGNKKSSH